MSKLEDKYYCPKCKLLTNHESLETHKEEGGDEDFQFQWIHEWMIVRCLGCETKSFLEIYSDSEMVEQIDDMSWSYVSEYNKFPSPPESKNNSRKVREAVLFQKVPKQLNELYIQIVKSYNDESLLLSSAGVRTLIEAICKEKSIKKGTLLDFHTGCPVLNSQGHQKRSNSLTGKVFGMFEKSLIVWNQVLVLQKIIEIGNSAVHDMQKPADIDVHKSIKIVEDILNQIYELSTTTFIHSK